MKPSPYTTDVTTSRVLVFVESEPVSNRYSQFELTEEQYLSLLKHLELYCPHVEEGEFLVPLKEVEITLPDTPAHL